jgi:hypothetical protein
VPGLNELSQLSVKLVCAGHLGLAEAVALAVEETASDEGELACAQRESKHLAVVRHILAVGKREEVVASAAQD